MTSVVSSAGTTDFYPRSPCGERPYHIYGSQDNQSISIHALLAESDTLICEVIAVMTISIHALLAESDIGANNHIRIRENFYPRSPCGERPNKSRIRNRNRDFYPRSPCGERQCALLYRSGSAGISIHALLAESDQILDDMSGATYHFYPRSPCGERPV